MRILHISKITGISGSEGHLLRLLPGLAQQGHDVQIVILEDPRSPASAFHNTLQQNGISVHCIPIRFHLDPYTLSQLTRLIRHLHPDIVHTHLVHADLYGLIAASQARVLIRLSTRHNDDKFRRNEFFKIINRLNMRLAQRVITISKALAGFVSTVEGIPASKIQTIHYGLEAPTQEAAEAARRERRESLGYQPEDQVIGFFGRLIEQKGVDVLLNAFGVIRKKYPKAKLLIMGDGRARAALEAQADQSGLREVTQFTGWRENAQRFMPACDIIAVPSRWEGFGLVTLEAMGWSRPIVASRASSLPEIIKEGETGLLVPPEDVQALADALETLLDNPDRAKQMGQAGYQRLVSDFSVEKMVCATLDLYRNLTERD
jgi:glycosyltransferase involved in cell wall biosynthesis